MQQTYYSCASVDQKSSPITPTLGLGTSRLSYGHWRTVAWSNESQFVFQYIYGRVRVCRLPSELLLPVIHRLVMGILSFRKVFMAYLGFMVLREQNRKVVDYLKIIADKWHSYIVSLFPNGKRLFKEANAPCQRDRNVLEWLQKHNAEFLLMFWHHNSLDFNPIQHIWEVI